MLVLGVGVMFVLRPVGVVDSPQHIWHLCDASAAAMSGVWRVWGSVMCGGFLRCATGAALDAATLLD
jgi:hypothetical protein